jgi:hypothetical protein
MAYLCADELVKRSLARLDVASDQTRKVTGELVWLAITINSACSIKLALGAGYLPDEALWTCGPMSRLSVSESTGASVDRSLEREEATCRC